MVFGNWLDSLQDSLMGVVNNEFVSEHLFDTITILIVAFVCWFFVKMLIGPVVKSVNKPERYRTARDKKLRDNTLISTITAGFRVTVLVLTVFALLAEFGLDLAPLLAGAGIVGVALGFGAQSLVRDYLSGLYVLIENQYRVGDVVRLNDQVSGVVERITLRQTVLRDLDGMQHHIPNGEIKLATNMTMDFANVNLDVGVAYETDIEKLIKIINKVGDDLAKDTEWEKSIIEAPQFARVDEFADSAMVVKIIGKTMPMRHWDVTGELRKRLKVAFDKNPGNSRACGHCP